MRIATNVHRDAFGGITISNLALFDWLSSREDQILGIEFTNQRSMQGAYMFRRYDPTFFQHHIINGFDIFDKYPWHTVSGEARLRRKWNVLIEETKRILREQQADVVLINGTYFAPWILAQAASDLHLPIVLRYAGILKREVAESPALDRWRLLHHERSIARQADALIFPSQLCRGIVEKEILERPTTQGFVVPNPVTVPVRRRSRSTASTRAIAAIGRWARVKNFQIFADIHLTLLRQRWTHKAYLVTPSRNVSSIIPQSITLIPPMNQEDLDRFYSEIGLLIVPSHFETFCNVAVEAVLRGTPVLISEQVGAADCLRAAGLERFVIPSFSDIALATKTVKRLCGSKISSQEKKLLKDILDPHRVHSELLNIIKQTVKRHRTFKA